MVDDEVDYLQIPVRVQNALRNADIRDISQLLRCSPGQMMRWPNFGRVSLADLTWAVHEVRRKLLDPTQRHDRWHIAHALGKLLDRVLAPDDHGERLSTHAPHG